MKFVHLFLLVNLIFQSCSEPLPKTEKLNYKLTFDYMLPVRGMSYSLKLNASDTVYIKETSPSLQLDTSYIALLSYAEHNKLDSLITQLNLFKLDTVYDSHDIDGEEYRLTILKNDSVKNIYVHSSQIPNKLNELLVWLVKFKKSSSQ